VKPRINAPAIGAIQLLVCLLVILVLAALALPIVTQHGGSSKNPCLSNLKQVGSAMNEYLSDWDDRFPMRDVWMNGAEKYAKTRVIFRCPHLTDRQPGYCGYSFNSWLSNRSYDTLKDPLAVPLAYDSINYAWNASDPFSSFPEYPSGDEKPMRRMLVFADTHARYLPPGKALWKP
jgi:hypothetical protein